MNIYGMYVQNGNQAGFWVVRAKWRNVIARVTDVASKTAGPIEGHPPYYGNPSVTAQFFNRHTGEPQAGWKDESFERALPCPGSYAYTLVPTSELPAWAKTPDERGEET